VRASHDAGSTSTRPAAIAATCQVAPTSARQTAVPSFLVTVRWRLCVHRRVARQSQLLPVTQPRGKAPPRGARSSPARTPNLRLFAHPVAARAVAGRAPSVQPCVEGEDERCCQPTLARHKAPAASAGSRCRLCAVRLDGRGTTQARHTVGRLRLHGAAELTSNRLRPPIEC
jgi:hypothetical protein